MKKDKLIKLLESRKETEVEVGGYDDVNVYVHKGKLIISEFELESLGLKRIDKNERN